MQERLAAQIRVLCNKFINDFKYEFESLKNENIRLKDDIDIVFLRCLERAFLQLESELKSDSFYYLPEINDADGESRSLLKDVEDCIDCTSKEDFENSSVFLKRIVIYQMRHGFWNKHPAISLQAYDDYIKKAHAEARSLNGKVRKLMEDSLEVGKSLGALNSKTEDNLVEALKRISKISSEASVKLADIESAYTSAKVYSDELPKIISDSNSVLVGLKSSFQDQERVISEILEKRSDLMKKDFEAREKIESSVVFFEEKLASVELVRSEVDEAVESIKSKEEYFKERNKYLDDLIGREVGSSLFETFKQRKNEISKGINFWKFSVLLGAIVCVAWIFFLFGIKDVSIMSWQMVLVNTLKTIPVVGLLIFAIAQYSKERDFQEEYAFKSAVALTINSYANQLDDRVNRDKLVMSSVEAVYVSPIQKRAKTSDAKDLTSAARDLVDTVKAWKG